MKTIPIPIILAAQARASGLSFKAAADAAGWPLDDLHCWIRKNAKQWYRALHQSRRDTRDSACDEAVAMMRQQLRDAEKKTIFNAADALAKRFAAPKVRPHAPRPPRSSEPPEQFRDWLAAVPEGVTTRVDLHLQACDDEERATASTPDTSQG